MYLKRLEIQGFKSFAKPTILEFQPGITAIVGPNGSGKSNIADAVRWVLGEQSKTLLRGKKAEDVIFVGSSTKSKASIAQVSVVFDNKDKKLPLDSAEVAISRRLHSDGTSEYLINNEPSRLMDIQEALIKAGFAPSRYTVMGQGVIDQFLLQGPAEIKAVIEEAAGLAPFYDKRDKTVRRLSGTRDNLTQVGALISEIEPRLRTLRRQAKKLSEREAVEQQWRELFSGRLAFIFSNLGKEKETLVAQIGSKALKIEALEKQTREGYAAIEKTDETQSKRSSKLSDLQNKLNVEQAKKEKLQLSLIEIRTKISVGVTSNGQDPAKLQVKVSGFQKELNELGREISEAEKNLKSTETDIKEIVAILQSAKPDLVPRFNNISDKFIASQKQFLGKLQIQRQDVSSLLEKYKLELSAAQSSAPLDKYQSEEKRVSEDLEKSEKVITQLRTELSNSLGEISTDTEERRTADKKIRAAEQELNRLRGEQNDLRVSLARVETHLEEEERKAREALGADFRKKIENFRPLPDPEIENQIANLRRQLEMIGGLDEMTMQEYEETEDRYLYLTTQVQDLEKAATDLEQVLAELEEVIKERFNTAFSTISDKFSEYFRLLFNGGKASLHLLKEKRDELAEDELIQEDKPAGTQIVGVEVKATPPGKKLSSIAALSGGERSLTSIALLMAMLDAHPSPFVVLDEADAALDESNSIRFAQILGHLSDQTQFITITHNRETMRRSHTLYGVTMGDDGISQILSIKFEDSKQFAKG